VSLTGAYCGEVDAELTPDGVRMAKEFADAYHSVARTAVYVSPMKRTIATARPLCDALGFKMELRPGLEEMHYGKWEDKTIEFVKEHYWDDYIHWLTEPAWNPPTGGETSVEIASRFSKSLKRGMFWWCLTKQRSELFSVTFWASISGDIETGSIYRLAR
jgi:broad specificity phosphatase PhoE